MLNDAELTPMYRQWAQAKRDYPDVLILFRMGDFYEMFGEDAEIGARLLELTLTSRGIGNSGRIPMCGVPHHAIGRYLRMLVEKGQRAAICEQIEDPKQAKGLVRRKVTRVITPGTLLEDDIIGGSGHNFLVSLARDGGAYGVAAVDVSTGDFLVTQIDELPDHVAPAVTEPTLPETSAPTIDPTLAMTIDEIVRVQPAELLISPELGAEEEIEAALSAALSVPVTIAAEHSGFTTPTNELQDHFGVTTLMGFGCADKPAAIAAAAQALRYVKSAQLDGMPRLTALTTYSTSDFMIIDGSTRRNLELVTSLRDGGRKATLLDLLDKTQTPMGGRILRSAVLQPLLSVERINERLDAVENFVKNPIMADQLRLSLREIYDLERLATRATAGRANARDLRSLCVSLEQLPALRDELATAEAELLHAIRTRIDTLDDIAELLEKAIVEDPPVLITEGQILKDGYNAELDELRGAASHGRQWIAALQDEQRARTGIKSLKVGFNKVFGYYIEVSKANLGLVPDDYQRKQTLVNAERFITPQLKEHEAKVLGADERSQELEHELFVALREQVADESERIMSSARAVGELDMIASLAEAAVEYAYNRPEIDQSAKLEISDGRHPVVERTLVGDLFVPNDAHLDSEGNRLQIVTGPNMAGKSTYLRQVALIALMAQMGSFVPARSARIGLLDRIFTRVGASDDLATGHSTFMVEMTEAANILQNATDRSLIVLDELGRGTSTYDGMSLAWAVSEYIVREIGAKTLFATHYHHLNELSELEEGAQNLRVAVKEEGDEIVFLRKIIPGGTDRSYGIQVARLAGLPPQVIERAREVLHTLEQEDISAGPSRQAAKRVAPTVQLRLFEGVRDPVVQRLAELDIETLSPVEALIKLKQLQDEASEGEGG